MQKLSVTFLDSSLCPTTWPDSCPRESNSFAMQMVVRNEINWLQSGKGTRSWWIIWWALYLWPWHLGPTSFTHLIELKFEGFPTCWTIYNYSDHQKWLYSLYESVLGKACTPYWFNSNNGTLLNSLCINGLSNSTENIGLCRNMLGGGSHNDITICWWHFTDFWNSWGTMKPSRCFKVYRLLCLKNLVKPKFWC